MLEPDESGGWRRWRTPRSMVYGTGPGSDPVGLIDDIMATATASGFRVESINAEFDESQFELTLEYDDALRAADDAFLFRVLAREVALRHGLDLTFLGKPFPELAGNGVHVNFSLVDANGNNAMADAAQADGLSALTNSCLGGLVAHHRALAAVCAPTVNAYRRLQPGQLNGYWANWGHEHRCAANRVPSARGAATRIENRIADGAGKPPPGHRRRPAGRPARDHRSQAVPGTAHPRRLRRGRHRRARGRQPGRCPGRPES